MTNINTDIFLLRQRLLDQLNEARSTFKKKQLQADHLGEEVVAEMLRLNISSTDNQFNKIVTDFKMVIPATIDYLVFEKQIPARMNLTSQDINNGFEKTFDEMINQAFKAKLLTAHSLTHIAIGLTMTGLKKDVYRISVLVTKKPISIDGFVRCQSVNQQETGVILVGKNMDIAKKPALVVINRDMQSQILIGPNRIEFNPENGEAFKVCIPDNYLGGGNASLSNLFASGNSNLIEVFNVPSNDNTVQYGQGQDISQQQWPNFNSIEIGIAEIMPILEQMLHKKMTLTLAMQQRDLLSGGQQSLSSTNGTSSMRLPYTQSSVNRPINTQSSEISDITQPKKTRSQMLREQYAAQRQGTSSAGSAQQQSQANGSSATSSLNRWNTQQQTSQFNTGGSNNNGSAFNSTAPATNPLVKPWQRNNTVANTNSQRTTLNNQNQGNQQNNFVSNNSTSSGFNQNFNTNQGFNNQNKNNNNNQVSNFNNNNGPNVVWPNQNNNTSNNNNNSNTSFQNNNQQQPTWNQNQNNNNNTFKFQTIQPSQSSQQSQQSYTQGNSQSQQTFSNQNNYQSQTTNGQNNSNSQSQTSSLRFNINPPNNSFQNNFNSQSSNNSQQQQPFKIQLNGSKTQQQTNQQNNQVQQQQSQIPPFNQLTITDQQILKSYYTEMAHYLNPDHQLLIYQLMCNDPISFEQYYQMASMEYKKQQQGIVAPELTQEIKKQREQKIQDFDDLTLFILTLPENLRDKDQARYNYVIAQFNEGKIDANKALLKIIVKSTYPKNESFKDLYGAKTGSDLILVYKNEKLYCHQVVFSANSQYFKNAIRHQEELNRYKVGPDATLKQTIVLPEQLDLTSMKLLIRFFYTGKISESSSTRPSTLECLNLLRTANYFKVDHLQERLIAEGVIPLLAPSNVYHFLKECLQNSQSHKESASFAWEALKEYCLFYLSKHLPLILRQDSVNLLQLDSETLRTVIEKSLYYLIDGTQDLEAILLFTAEAFANRDIYQVLLRSQYRFEKCSAFDYQIVPEMAEFMHSVDFKTSYQCHLIQGKKNTLLDSNKTKSTENQKSVDQLDSQFIPKSDLRGIYNREEFDINGWKPATNYVRDKEGKREAQKTNEPVFQMTINLEALKDKIKLNKGATIISEAFDFGRRSWHLKVDITVEEQISLWLVERGPAINVSEKLHIGASLPVNFSSLLVEFELTDAAIGDHKTPIFFSFAHDTHQIIGQQNFITVPQLQNKNSINIKLQLKEFILHSALMHFYTNNFYTLYKREFSILKSFKQQNYPNTSPDKGCLLNLPFYTVYQILSSNYLKVDIEDYVLSFLYHYTKRFYDLAIEAASVITNLLITCLRFCYLSLDKILTAIKDNEFLRQSPEFIDRIKSELQIRASPITIISTSSDKKQQIEEPLRKYYDASKVQASGRRKIETLKNGKSAQTNLLEEVIEWAIKTKNHNDASGEQNQRLKDQLFEERRKVLKLENDIMIIQRNFTEQQKQIQLQQQQQANQGGQRKVNNSWDDRNKVISSQQQKQESIGLAKAMTSRSPPRNLPQYLDQSLQNNKVLNNSYSGGGAYYNYKINDNLLDRRPNDSTRFAEQKLQDNLKQDFSLILDKMNSPTQRNTVPYYKTKETNNDCIIF